jgi:hypothetical protein
MTYFIQVCMNTRPNSLFQYMYFECQDVVKLSEHLTLNPYKSFPKHLKIGTLSVNVL